MKKKYKCIKCKELRKQLNNEKKFHNKVNTFVDNGLRLSEKDFKELIENKTKLVVQLTDMEETKRSKAIIRRLKALVKCLYYSTKFKATTPKLRFLKLLKYVSIITGCWQIIGLIRMKGFTFELISLVFELFVNMLG